MLRTWWKMIRTITVSVGVLLTFFVIIEVLRAYQTLHEIHPLAGYVFVGVLAAFFAWLAIYIIRNLASRPAVIVPPVIGDIKTASDRKLLQFARYLEKYLVRLGNNPSLSHDMRKQVRVETANFVEAFNTGRNGPYLKRTIEEAQENAIGPALLELDNLAEKEVRACVSTVMAGVTLSPYKAADLMIVIYRNVVMTARIMRIYNSRPRTRQMFKTVSDIIAVVATVNYINMGKNLIEGLTSRAPFIGRYSDDIAQGIGAGFMTSIVGHAAMFRSRAYTKWNRKTAARDLKAMAADFYDDVRDMFKKDILPTILHRLGDVSRDTIDKICIALDETGNRVNSFIRVPFGAAVNAGASRTMAVCRTSAKGVTFIGRLAAKIPVPLKKSSIRKK